MIKSQTNSNTKFTITKKLVCDFGIVLSVLFVICGLYIVIFTDCYAQSITSTELINNAKQYDAKTVTYEGEAIGDIMIRGDYAWVNVNDGNNAIGVWLSSALAKGITYTGSYKSKGEAIEITGIFHRACPEHGGDLDIHAQTIRKIGVGRAIAEKLNVGKRNFAAILLGILGIIWILSLFDNK